MPLCSPAWRRIGASDTVVDWVTNGVQMCFNSEPEPYVCKKNTAFTGAESEFVSAEIDKLLNTKNTLFEAHDSSHRL